MRRRILTATLLALLAGVCALAVLPARWLLAVWPETGWLVVADAQGSIWSGSATLAIGRPELRRTLPQPLRWTFRFSGGPHWVASHPALGGAVRITPTWRGLRVSAQTLRLPATALSTLHAALGALQPGGELRLNWSENTLGFTAPPAGRTLLELRWNTASTALSRIRPMGSYRAVVTQGENGRADVALSTLSGPLVVQARGTWTARDGLRFQGTARADAKAPPDTQAGLTDLLNALGPRQGDHHDLRFR